MTPVALRPVAAVVTDDLDAVRTVRYAARLARVAQRPLLLLVPLPGAGLAVDAVLHEVTHRRRDGRADAVLSRVTPVLERHKIPVSTRVVLYPPRRTRTPGLGAVLSAARRAGADVLVAGPRWAGRRGTRGMVLLDPGSGLASSGQLAPAPGIGHRAAEVCEDVRRRDASRR